MGRCKRGSSVCYPPGSGVPSCRRCTQVSSGPDQSGLVPLGRWHRLPACDRLVMSFREFAHLVVCIHFCRCLQLNSFAVCWNVFTMSCPRCASHLCQRSIEPLAISGLVNVGLVVLLVAITVLSFRLVHLWTLQRGVFLAFKVMASVSHQIPLLHVRSNDTKLVW